MKPSLIMEIVGPSGAGKSTLSKLLRAGGLNAGISVWGLPSKRLAMSAIKMSPSAMRMSFGREEIKQMIRLDALRGYLKSNASKALLLDEGPVFAISKMWTNRNEDHSLYSRWEESALDDWSQVLDGVIMLDAPDDILIERMRSRTKQHRMKEKNDREINEFLSRYRDAFEKTIGGLKHRKELKVLKFDTSLDSLEHITGEITGICEIHELPESRKALKTDREYFYEKTAC